MNPAQQDPILSASNHFVMHHRNGEASRKKASRVIGRFRYWWQVAVGATVPVLDCGQQHAVGFRNWLLAQQFTASDVSYHLSTLKGLWDILLARGHAKFNPFHSKVCPRPVNNEAAADRPSLTEQDLAHVFRETNDGTAAGRRDALLIALLYVFRDTPLEQVVAFRKQDITPFLYSTESGALKLAANGRSWAFSLPFSTWLASLTPPSALCPGVDRSGRRVPKPTKGADKSRMYSALSKRGRQASLSQPLTPTAIRTAEA